MAVLLGSMTRRSLASVVLLAMALTALLVPSVSAATTIVLQPGQQVTVASFSLGVGEDVDYWWDASGLVELRVRNEDFDITVELTNTAFSGTFTAFLPGTYTFRFENVQENPTYAVTLTYSVGQSNFLLIAAAIGVVAALAVFGVLLAWYLGRRRRQMIPPPPYAPPPYTPPPQPPQT